jgi:hypothetical protein
MGVRFDDSGRISNYEAIIEQKMATWLAEQ